MCLMTIKQEGKKYISLIIKPTDACNLRCKHCYAAETGYSAEQMSLETARKIFNLFAKDYDEIRIIWHGGEPLLMGLDFYKEIVKLQCEYSEKKFVNDIQSNATLITDEWIDFFVENEIKMGFSFDGQYNDVLRSQTKQVLRAINLMKSKGYRSGAICVVSSKTADKLIDIYEFFKCIGISYKISPMFQAGEAKKHSMLALSTNKYVKHFLDFFKYWLEDTTCNIDVNYALDYVAQYLGKRETLCTNTSCLTRWLGIHFNGDIYPCGREYPEEYNLGNISDFESAKDIFLTENYQRLLAGAIKRRDDCKAKCKLYDKCFGGCNNSAILEGDISKSGFQECKIYKKLYKEITAILDKKFVGSLDEMPNLNPTIKKIKIKKEEVEWN